MKRHMKIWIGLLSLFLTTNLFAQQTGKIENGFNVDDYPEVSFIYHSYNPDVLDKSDFWHLKEAGANREFNIEVLPAADNYLPQTTIILWEDMAHNGYGQFDFTQKALAGFFNHADIPASDKFAVSAFNRRKNTSSSLIDLTNGFTNDKSQILSAIQSYKHSTEYYSEFPNRSDMYTAIREGMELLAPLKGAKAIVVFTSGYSMKTLIIIKSSITPGLRRASQQEYFAYFRNVFDKPSAEPNSFGLCRGEKMNMK